MQFVLLSLLNIEVEFYSTIKFNRFLGFQPLPIIVTFIEHLSFYILKKKIISDRKNIHMEKS